jgi:UDP-GlcNAc:undecaprenyl-phosphate GlcNAc-1-phosphate transferase
MGLAAVIIVVSLAFTVTLVLTPAARNLAWKFNAVSRPDGNRRQHARPTAVWGGVAVFAGLALGIAASCLFLIGIVDTLSLVSLMSALCISSGMLCLLGCYDDAFDMRAGSKLFGQIVSILPIIAAGCSASHLCFFGWEMDLGWFGIPCTIIWLILGINALNLIDGIDGLASLLGLAIAGALAAIAFGLGLPDVMMVALTLCGALAGFLVHNRPPAKIYLGDCGSMVIGLVLATLALRVGPMPGTASLTVLGALLFVPLLDTTLAVIRRILSGRGLMAADRGHVHHRLLDRGLSIWATLAFLGSLCLISGAVAWTVSIWQEQEFAAWAVMAGITAICVNRRLLGHEEWGLAREQSTRIAASVIRGFSTADTVQHQASFTDSPTTVRSPGARDINREIANGRTSFAKRN